MYFSCDRVTNPHPNPNRTDLKYKVRIPQLRIIAGSVTKVTQLFVRVTEAVVQSSSHHIATHCVLLVLWMTSCFLIVDPVPYGVGSVYVSAVPEQLVINLQQVRQGGTTLFDLVSSDDVACCHWLVACSVQYRSRGQSLLSVIALFHCRAGRMLFLMPNQQCHSAEGK